MNLKWKRIAIHVESDFIELMKLREIALGIAHCSEDTMSARSKAYMEFRMSLF